MWYTKFGNMGDVVLSSRIRLARNINKIPFGTKMTEENRNQIIEQCKSALPDLKFIDLQNMQPIERLALSECHLISPEIASSEHKCGILTNEACNLCVMLCEEDHIRIQSMCGGFDIFKCMDLAKEIDQKLDDKLAVAFDPEFGFLTCCPTNTGTGLRASVMMHLPGLTESGNIDSLIRNMAKHGFTVRGIYGEGSQALGNIYQISNQVTMGISEKETIDKLHQIVTEIIQKERSTGQQIYESNHYRLEDRIMRGKGLLENARIMSSNEAMNLLSDVRWGINLGIIKDIDLETLSVAMYKSLPANITKTYNLTTAMERDIKRSEVLSQTLQQNRKV